MKEYIIRYRIKTLTKSRIAVVKISLLGDDLAIDLCNEIQQDGNYVEELYNSSDKKMIYNHKKPRYSHILKIG